MEKWFLWRPPDCHLLGNNQSSSRKNDKKSISISEQFKSTIGIFGGISNQFINNKTGVNIKEIYDTNKHPIDVNKIYEQIVQ